MNGRYMQSSASQIEKFDLGYMCVLVLHCNIEEIQMLSDTIFSL